MKRSLLFLCFVLSVLHVAAQQQFGFGLGVRGNWNNQKGFGMGLSIPIGSHSAIQIMLLFIGFLFCANAAQAQEKFEIGLGARLTKNNAKGGAIGINIPVLATGSVFSEWSWMQATDNDYAYSSQLSENLLMGDILYRINPLPNKNWKVQWLTGAGLSVIRYKAQSDVLSFCDCLFPEPRNDFFITKPTDLNRQEIYLGSTLHNTIRVNLGKHLSLDTKVLFNLYMQKGFESYEDVIGYYAFQAGLTYRFNSLK
jgi:hypothetical protein